MTIKNNFLFLLLLSFSISFCCESIDRLIDETIEVESKGWHIMNNELRKAHNAQLHDQYAKLINAVISKKINLNSILDHNFPILVSVAKKGFNDLVIKVLDNGANIEIKGSDGSALSSAAEYGHFETVKLLLDRGADTENGHPLIEAAELISHKTEKKVSILSLLLERGAKVNAQCFFGFTALHHILRREQLFPVPIETITSLIKTFVHYGADINIKNYDEDTPLSLAQFYYPQVVPIMLKMQEERKT